MCAFLFAVLEGTQPRASGHRNSIQDQKGNLRVEQSASSAPSHGSDSAKCSLIVRRKLRKKTHRIDPLIDYSQF